MLFDFDETEEGTMASGPWFRMYCAIADSSKVRDLTHEEFWWWVHLLCLYKESGTIPALDDQKGLKTMAWRLRVSQEALAGGIKALADNNLLDPAGEVPGYVPHDWGTHQYQSDSSTERVRRFRERSRNVSGAPRARVENITNIYRTEQNRDGNVPETASETTFYHRKMDSEVRFRSDLGDAGLDDRVQALCSRHPRRDRASENLVAVALLDVAAESGLPVVSGVLVQVEAAHSGWSKSDEWTRENGRYCPRLDRWIRERGFRQTCGASVEAPRAFTNAKDVEP